MADERVSFAVKFAATIGNAPKFFEHVRELSEAVDDLRAADQRKDGEIAELKRRLGEKGA